MRNIIGTLAPLNILRYLEYMTSLGYPQDQVLSGSGLSNRLPQELGGQVDIQQARVVIDNMIKLTGDPALGLTVGNSIKLSEFGIVGHALMSSTTMRQASQLCLQYGRQKLGLMPHWTLGENADGSWKLCMDKPMAHPQMLRFCTEEMLVIGRNIVKTLFGESMQVQLLRLGYEKPSYWRQYRSIFGAPIEFWNGETVLEIQSPSLDQPLRHDEDEFAEICLRHCARVMHQLPSGAAVSTYLRNLFLRNAGALPMLPEAATSLGMTGRTLRRRLEKENTTYQQLTNCFRRDLAIEYLKSPHIAPKEVAYLLGFKTPSDFRRAFKSWTGITVGKHLENSLRDG